ncbi:DNA-binding protein [Pseudomonas mangiferae]|uniref:DNA-binding protein n=1 Tax=Pseudomonas mangiferae TaxID=2593654 RepID=A0A553H1P9_9PSED|nr:DNA-binding protein [Pseudomonas mangiferae]TRX75652.1 DNA-binding protein [Pseudomonas mangiferae]
MAQGIADRAHQLLNATSLKELAEVNSKDYVRWQSIKRGRARVGAEEVELLGRLYPQYRWWLMTGEVMPDKGQVSPDYVEANRNLISQSTG